MHLAEMIERFRRHDRQALARMLTLVARHEHSRAILAALAQTRPPAPARVIAFTGSAGVGKSTLVGKLIEQLRGRGRSVAVLACDPESPLTGGALLGDRFRMPARPDDLGLYIRSVATAGGQEAIAAHLDDMIRVLEQFGFDDILIETVGAGQGDTAVRAIVDAVVLLLQPESGDDIQWEKAGLLEVADLVVIHKADLPGADQVEAQVKSLLNLPGCREVPVFRVSSARGTGLDELAERIEQFPLRRGRPLRDPRSLLRLLQQRMAEGFQVHDGFPHLVARWQQGDLGDEQVLKEVLAVLIDPTLRNQSAAAAS